MSWIFHSKNLQDEYVNMFAKSARATPVSDIDYENTTDPIVLRGILKHKLMKRCWDDKRDFYYIDSGYVGNNPNPHNPNGWKVWHRIVKNDLQHNEIIERPADRWARLGIELQPRRYGKRIIVAVPDEKPCKFYGIDWLNWIENTVNTIKQHTDRPIVIRQRAPNRLDRVTTDPLLKVLQDDVHALVTFNSNAATESIISGVPAFTLAPTHAALPVANVDLSQIETPYWADQDKRQAWANHLAYGQFHVHELRDGTAYRILNAR